MDEKLKSQIVVDQEDYFNEELSKDFEGNSVKRGQYKQILESDDLGYWVDVHDGPDGKSYTIYTKEGEV